MSNWLTGLTLLVLACLPSSRAQQSLDSYVNLQTAAALSGIRSNTYNATSQYPGVIIASPALDTARAGESGGQNYFYQWTRDAALTVKVLINQYASGDVALEPFLRAYVENESKLQHLTTLSGNFSSGGLGEPKYYVNSTAFMMPWGRPQRDGPALRAISIMGFLGLLSDAQYIKNVTENVVRPDLDYVARHWNETGFDLWEEQDNLHFFTAMVQARALRMGAAFMSAAGYSDSAALYSSQIGKVNQLVETFWNSSTHTFDAQLNLTKPTGADCGNLLASIHGSDGTSPYEPSSSKILASVNALVEDFTGLYPIDRNHNLSAISVGRYASDVYDGIQSSKGNPWFLCNSAVAETLYLASTELQAAGSVTIDDINTSFFRRFSSTISPGSKLTGSNLTAVLQGMRQYADDFLAIEQLHVGTNYSMAEEFNRTTGAQQGARDLTWSYAAFVTAARARAGQLTYNFTRGYSSNHLDDSSVGNTSTNTSITTLGTLTQARVESNANQKTVSISLACVVALCILLTLL